jgi:cobalamin biosynthesis Mg chelatase CobN
VVALVLLALIMRDQHKAIVAVEGSLAAAGEAPAVASAQAGTPESAGAEPTAADVEPAPAETQTATATAATATAARVHAGTVERGRIASLAGVVSLIWLVILVLMVWRP